MPKTKDPRRVNDFWTKKAKKERYPARSVYKLQEIDEKFRLIEKNSRILDLGSSPGSWMIYAAKRTGPGGLVAGLDLKNLELKPAPNMHFVKADVYEFDFSQAPFEQPFDAVMSDMAPSTTGIKNTDQARSVALASHALDIARRLLKPGGWFLVKVFEGPDVAGLMDQIKDGFRLGRRLKPVSSRKISPEIFLLGQDFGK